MPRTTLQELTPLQSIIDEKMSGNESQVEQVFLTGTDLDQIIERFVELLNGNELSDPCISPTLFSKDQFKHGGELKQFFEQLYIGIFTIYSTSSTEWTFWRNTLYLTAWRSTLDLSQTGGYILARMNTNCSTTTTLYWLLNVLGGNKEAGVPDRQFGYLPKHGSIELEFMNFIGVCTDSNEYSRRLKSYCTLKNNEKIQMQVKKASNSDKRDEARIQRLRSKL
jgi:hypothetical protein